MRAREPDTDKPGTRQAAKREALLRMLREAADAGDVISGALLVLIHREVESFQTLQDVIDGLAEALGGGEEAVRDVP
jgi:hypothetical protein